MGASSLSQALHGLALVDRDPDPERAPLALRVGPRLLEGVEVVDVAFEVEESRPILADREEEGLSRLAVAHEKARSQADFGGGMLSGLPSLGATRKDGYLSQTGALAPEERVGTAHPRTSAPNPESHLTKNRSRTLRVAFRHTSLASG